MSAFDAIVIGSGLGGLSGAALLARAGRRVLVLERNADFGGAATVFRHGTLAIEASLHETSLLGRDDPRHGLLHRLGVADRLNLVRIPELYEVRGKALPAPFRLPDGFDAAVEAGVAAFPAHADGVRRYFRALRGVARSFDALSHQHEHRVTELLGAALAGDLWQLLRRTRWSTLRMLQDCFGGDPLPPLALAANLCYLHDDPAELWFPLFAIAQAGYLRDGGHYIAGGSRALTDALVGVIRDHGGHVVAHAAATGIALDAHGEVAAVRWLDADGNEQSQPTRAVLGNAAPERLEAMLPAEAAARFGEPHRGLVPSISLFTVSLGVDRPAREFGVGAYSTFLLPDWMTRLEQMPQAAALPGADPGQRLPMVALVDYSRIASGLNADGLHLLSLTGVDRLANWQGLDAGAAQARKQRWIDALVADLDRHYPGIAGSVRQSEMATAVTMQHYLGTPGGATYGYAPTVERFSRPPSAKTAVPGLFVASAYTTSGGFEGALIGGAMAAHAAREHLARHPRA